ncbi:MAG: glutamate racemase [Campylobacterales bacterium]|nr:glutamate racemase [Campylobacterales bacterium]
MRVGVFDSGVGGLTVVKSLLTHKLFKEIIYYGDTARVPYGTKDKNTIIRYSLEVLEFFKNFDIDMLIVACNTASAYALDELRANTDIPIVGVIESGILSMEKSLPNKESNILILGTQATINSNKYQDALNEKGYKNITSIATGLFVPIVEEQLQNTSILEHTFDHYFKDLKDVDGVILGCTHFPLIQNQISNYLDGVLTIHSGEAIVQYLESNYQCDSSFDKTDIQFFASSNPDGLKDVADKWLRDI